MSNSNTHETDIHDLSLGVIHALALLDVKALSYVQLRRLNAALIHASEDVAQEAARRSDDGNGGDTIRTRVPQ